MHIPASYSKYPTRLGTVHTYTHAHTLNLDLVYVYVYVIISPYIVAGRPDHQARLLDRTSSEPAARSAV
jgi:hypothetical protein